MRLWARGRTGLKPHSSAQRCLLGYLLGLLLMRPGCATLRHRRRSSARYDEARFQSAVRCPDTKQCPGLPHGPARSHASLPCHFHASRTAVS